MIKFYKTLALSLITFFLIGILVNENLKPGKYVRSWNAAMIASGVYFYELKAGDFKDVKKMILVK